MNNSTPTLLQKKAILRTMFDLLRHGKEEISISDQQVFFYIGRNVLDLTDDDIQLLSEMNNVLQNIMLISKLNMTYQIAFRKIMYHLLTENRTPSITEKKNYNNILSVIPNNYNLPITFDTFRESKYFDDDCIYNSPEYSIRPWNFSWKAF